MPFAADGCGRSSPGVATATYPSMLFRKVRLGNAHVVPEAREHRANVIQDRPGEDLACGCRQASRQIVQFPSTRQHDELPVIGLPWKERKVA